VFSPKRMKSGSSVVSRSAIVHDKGSNWWLVPVPLAK